MVPDIQQIVPQQGRLGVISFNGCTYGVDDIIVLRFRALQDRRAKTWGKIQFFDSTGGLLANFPQLRVYFPEGFVGGEEVLLFRQDFYGQFPGPWYTAVFTLEDPLGYPLEREIAFGYRDREILGTIPPRPLFRSVTTSVIDAQRVVEVTVNAFFLDDDASFVMLRFQNGRTFIGSGRNNDGSVTIRVPIGIFLGAGGLFRPDVIVVNKQGAVTYPRAAEM